ncbi:MAG: hypothetical protein WCF85_12310, partial [Rhodospirillaceae bacterium]
HRYLSIMAASHDFLRLVSRIFPGTGGLALSLSVADRKWCDKQIKMRVHKLNIATGNMMIGDAHVVG